MKAFTLVEMLIVVVMLALIAAIVMPQFSNASATARTSMLMDDLRVLRTQVEVFKGQHRGVAPGYPDCDPTQEPTEAVFIAHMTQSSNESGQTRPLGTAGYRYGPYFREIPQDPVNGKSSVKVIGNGQAAPSDSDDAYGWLYQPESMTFKAACAGKDDGGRRLVDY